MCKFIVYYMNYKTRCMIYPHRLGAVTGEKQACGLRKDFPYDVPGCPYNTGKPMHPAFKQ